MKQSVKNQNRLKRAQTRLRALLDQIDPQRFFALIWATRAIQKPSKLDACKYFSELPKEAVDAEIGNRFWVPPWTLETLVNEYLKQHHGKSAPAAKRSIQPIPWGYLAALVNAINNLEESETIVFGKESDIFKELVRIKYRQFHWQSGIAVYPALYRSFYLMNNTYIHASFEAKTGTTFDNFTKCAMGMWVEAQGNPSAFLTNSYDAVGLDLESKKLALSPQAISWADATLLASKTREEIGNTAYGPSVLRKHPTILLPGGAHGPTRACFPLHDLIINRTTTDVFYDAVVEDDRCRTIYADRFEQYCYNLLSSSFPGEKWSREISYGPKSKPQASPDIFTTRNDIVSLIVECKARRVPFKFKTDMAELENLEGSLKELAKGLFQVWRFSHDIRCGFVPDKTISEDAFGLVVTYEDWATILPDFWPEIERQVAELSAQKDIELTPHDRVPTCFVSIETLDQISMSADLESIKGTVHRYRSNYLGWELFTAWQHENPEADGARPYIFKDELSGVLPWLGALWDETTEN